MVKVFTLPTRRRVVIRRENFKRINSGPGMRSVHYDLVVNGTARRVHIIWDNIGGTWSAVVRVDEDMDKIVAGAPWYRHDVELNVGVSK